jgi:hypothetical protein
MGPTSYFDFAPMFRAELCDPDQCADIFVHSGAKYVALTSKHHEGFPLWASTEVNQVWGRLWNSLTLLETYQTIDSHRAGDFCLGSAHPFIRSTYVAGTSQVQQWLFPKLISYDR